MTHEILLNETPVISGDKSKIRVLFNQLTGSSFKHLWGDEQKNHFHSMYLKEASETLNVKIVSGANISIHQGGRETHKGKVGDFTSCTSD